MLTHPTDLTLWLATPADFADGAAPEPARAQADAFQSVLRWAEEYLTEPHPDLGRDGPVCPFVRRSLDEERLLMTVLPGHPDAEAVRGAVRQLRDWFLAISSEAEDERDAQHTAILLLMPDLREADEIRTLVDGTQEALKPEFVERGIMVGEFHPLPPEKPGLWNPDFRPLRCPVPLIAIRHMVASDYAFLRGEPRFMEAYLDNVGDEIPPALEDDVEEAAEEVGIDVDLGDDGDDADEEGGASPGR